MIDLNNAQSCWIAAARVKIRRDFGEVRPEAEQLDGNTFFFKFAWVDDTGRYDGEDIWQPWDKEYPQGAPAWIAEGDLDFDCDPLPGERLLR